MSHTPLHSWGWWLEANQMGLSPCPDNPQPSGLGTQVSVSLLPEGEVRCRGWMPAAACMWKGSPVGVSGPQAGGLGQKLAVCRLVGPGVCARSTPAQHQTLGVVGAPGPHPVASAAAV